MAFRGRGRGGFHQGPPQHHQHYQVPVQPPNPPPPQEEEQPGPSQGGKSRRNKRQDRAQTFRRNNNQKVINEFAAHNQQALKTNLFSEFASLSEALKTTHVEPQPYDIRFSFSTRGIGLTLFECFQRAVAQFPEIDIPLHCFYRVSLLHLAAKYDTTMLSGTIGFTEQLAGEYTTLLTVDIRDVVKMNPLNFSPVSGIVNCLGHFTVEDVNFTPSLLQQQTPLTVSISNLRDIVVMLSNVNTPWATRLEYVRLDSIPGAQFEDEMNPILVNADEIMPADYAIGTVRNDFLRVKACLARIGRKLEKLVGAVTFDAKGNAGQLLTTEVYGRSPSIWSFVEFNANNGTYYHNIEQHVTGDAQEWMTSRKLTQEQVVCGAITLCGEIVVQRPAEIIVPWSLNRSPRCAITRYNFSRENIISGMIG